MTHPFLTDSVKIRTRSIRSSWEGRTQKTKVLYTEDFFQEFCRGISTLKVDHVFTHGHTPEYEHTVTPKLRGVYCERVTGMGSRESMWTSPRTNQGSRVGTRSTFYDKQITRVVVICRSTRLLEREGGHFPSHRCPVTNSVSDRLSPEPRNDGRVRKRPM